MPNRAILTLQGLEVGWESRIHEALGGLDGTYISVDYGASLGVSLARGARILDDAVNEALKTFDQVTIIGHSRGAITAGVWMDRHGRENDRSDRVDLILLANPNRKYGGSGLGERTPTDTPYKVIDIARRWDGWSNHDNWPDKPNLLARLRLFLGRLGKTGPHADFSGVRIEDCKKRAEEGRTTYLVAD